MTDQERTENLFILMDRASGDENIRMMINVVCTGEHCLTLADLVENAPEAFDDLFEACVTEPLDLAHPGTI